MQDEYNERVRTCDLKNSQLQNTAESMRLSILGKDSKTKDDKLGLDADEIINMKMSQNEAKYPVDKAKGSAAKYDQL